MQCNHLLAYIYWRNRNDSLSCFKYILMSQDCSLRISGRICFKNQGWYRVLNSWKSLEICLDLDKSGNWEVKSEKKIVISSEFFFSKLQQLLFKVTNVLVLVKSYSILSIGLQGTMKKALFLRTLLITYLLTLSLEKGIIVWRKVWKKSWILDPKICANTVKSITCFIHLIEQ